MGLIKKFFRMRESTLIIVNLLIILVMSLLFENFATRPNIFGLLYYISVYSIIAGPMTVLLISGGFDLSAGVMIGLAGVIIGRLIISFNFPIIIALILTVLICAIIGTLNGYIIEYLCINPFFVTLSAYFIINAVIYIIADQKDIFGFPQEYNLLAGFKILSIPIILIFSLVSLIIFDVLLRRNIYFRQNYAIGGNELGAILAGIKVKRLKMFNYTIISTMAGIAGILFSSRIMAAYRNAGADAVFIIITAVIIGGASLKGGRGSVAGSFLGLVLMALINNAIVFFQLHAMWGRVTMGVVLIMVVLLDENLRKEKTVKLRT